MTGYTKLFGSILHSTIWREPNHVRIVWITLLAMTGKSSVAETSLPGLADAARISIEDCQDALQRLQMPDPYSRTSDFNGRRIEAAEGGWRIVNHSKYRAKMDADGRREYLRIKQAEYRARGKVAARPDVNTNVNICSDCTQSTHNHKHNHKQKQKYKKSVCSEPLNGVPPTTASAEPSNGSSPPTAQVAFRTKSAGNAYWELPEAQIVVWRAAYPALDVLQECAQAAVWLEANPTRRKTVRGMRRFLVNWLKRSADRRGSDDKRLPPWARSAP